MVPSIQPKVIRVLPLTIVCMLWFATAVITKAQTDDMELPDEKQTSLGLYLTAKEAYEKWKANPDKVIVLDVRINEEFLFIGHPVMAWNIPAFLQDYHWDVEKKKLPMYPNPDFLEQVKTVVKPEDTLLVTCRSGGRSALAINQLAAAGYKNVYNITDGVEGDKVKDKESVYYGQRVKNGWKNSGLPWTYEIAPEKMFVPESAQTLQQK